MRATDYYGALNFVKVGNCQERVVYLFSSLHQIYYLKISRLAIFIYKLLKDSKVYTELISSVCDSINGFVTLSSSFFLKRFDRTVKHLTISMLALRSLLTTWYFSVYSEYG